MCYVGPARARGGTECSYGSAWFEPVRGAPRAAILGGIARVGFSHQRALPRPPFKFKISRAELEKLETSLSNSEQGARAKSKNDPRETQKNKKMRSRIQNDFIVRIIFIIMIFYIVRSAHRTAHRGMVKEPKTEVKQEEWKRSEKRRKRNSEKPHGAGHQPHKGQG